MEASLPSTYEIIHDLIMPLNLMMAIVCAYLVHEYLTDRFDPPQDPDGFV